MKPAIVPVPRPRSAPGPAGPGAVPPVPRSGGAAPGDAVLDAIGGRPVRLDVDLGRGLRLRTPVVAAAGPFGYGVEVAELVDLERLGALVTRTTTPKPRGARAGGRIVEVPAGLLVGTAPQNPGLEAVLDRYPGTWARWPVPVILSLAADGPAELADAARRCDGVPGIAGLELNLSCGGGGRGGTVPGLDPDAAAAAVAAVRRATALPLLAKLSPAAADLRAVARAVEAAGADVLVAVNTLPGLLPAADRSGPALGGDYGGICGPALRPVALRIVWEIAQVAEIPVVGTGGIAGLDDLLDHLACGAVAGGVGVAALADPMLPVRLADELADHCRSLGIAEVAALVGTALPPRPTQPSTRGAQYAR